MKLNILLGNRSNAGRNPQVYNIIKPVGLHFVKKRFFLLLLLVGFAISLTGVLLFQEGNAFSSFELQQVYHKWGSKLSKSMPTGTWDVYTDTTDRQEYDCGKIMRGNTMVALVFGQSNAANSVEERYSPTGNVFVYYDNHCYKADDPLPGTSHFMGSTWSRLGDKIIASKLYDNVLFIDIARGGASILNWGLYGDLNELLVNTLQGLQEQHISLTHVFFHQGETDSALGLSKKDYEVVLQTILNQTQGAIGKSCPIFVSQASLYKRPGCDNIHDKNCYAISTNITDAQREVVDATRNIHAGPNTDKLLPFPSRFDGYHFSAAAADLFADSWLSLLSQP